MKLIKFFFLAFAVFCVTQPLSAKKITVHVVPENAKIYCNGDEVGSGIYEINFGRKDDFVMLKFTAPGYIARSVKLFKKNPKNTVSYQLAEDLALKNSVGAESGMDLANRNFTITCKQGMTPDVVWKRLMNIAINNFENIEIRDQSAGWIRTAWAKTRFASGDERQEVRTRLEIRLQFAGEGELAYRVKLTSEIAEGDCYSEECFVPYDRLLKKYENIISELQTTLGANY